MTIAVLLKAVPLTEDLRYDPVQRAVVREGVELVVNAFDQRALRVALELRRPGETVVALSLGPPEARRALRQARSLGVDRVLHLVDRAFAGSDVLATSTALAALLRRLGASLILAGARSTDSDTGLVGPEVAALLGIPVVTGARAVRWGAEQQELEVDVDTPTGWASVRTPVPALVTVGEKIRKPLPIDPGRLEQVREEEIESIGLDGLGLGLGEVGTHGSPTRVGAVTEISPTRLARVFSTGDVAQRVADAVAALDPLLSSPGAPPLPLPPRSVERDPLEVVVLVSEGLRTVTDGGRSVLTHLRRSLPRASVSAIVYGRRPTAAESEALDSAGADQGYHLPAESRFDSSDVARGVGELVDRRSAVTAVVCLATPLGREVAGRLAAERRLGAIGDAIAVGEDRDGALVWTKPSFGGTTNASITSRTRPTVVTMPPGLAAPGTRAGAPAPLQWTEVPVPVPLDQVRTVAEGNELLPGPDVDGSDVVVAVGTGVGGPEALAGLAPVLRAWDASVVGTRRVVDAGWLPVHRQVGLTGRSLAPRLAILLGVRGAAYHMAGWTRAATILAVNRDPDAPVFRYADVGIVGSVEEVVPALAGPLASRLRRSPPL